MDKAIELSYLDIVTLAVFGGLIALLIRAAYVLGRNPYQQISEHERLTGHRFPPDIPMAERLRQIDRWGVSPTKPKRLWWLIALVTIAFAVLVAVR